MMRLTAAIFLALWATLAHSADLLVRVQGTPDDGVLVLQVYDSPNAFGDFRDPLREVHAPIQADNLYRIDDVPSGDIAILVYVDENENGLIDKNFIGIPKEPLAIYERIHGSRGNALALLDGEYCSACMERLTRNDVFAVQNRSRLVQCRGCNRILIFDV